MPDGVDRWTPGSLWCAGCWHWTVDCEHLLGPLRIALAVSIGAVLSFRQFITSSDVSLGVSVSRFVQASVKSMTASECDELVLF